MQKDIGVMLHKGSCHCGSIKFEFTGEEIVSGLRCNCSLCEKKGAIMTEYAVAPNNIKILVTQNSLSTYDFGSEIAKHHFCNKCGIYTFHQTKSQPGFYRINIGCISGIKSSELPF
ncbi:MAG: GFA family protein, partial [Colwellia sp.]|nr:GFA family protein [Colwellia sp.]